MPRAFSEIPYELRLLDNELRGGNPVLGWPGDRRMELRMGVLLATRYGYDPQVKRTVNKGDPVARRIEVWRHTERGEDVRIGTWSMEEVQQVIPDLVLMDPSRPGHISVLDRIDRHNAQLEAAADQAYFDAAGEMHEHLFRLNHDRNNPRNIFRGIPGTRDRADLKRADKQASDLATD